jgi:hypothetical protein
MLSRASRFRISIIAGFVAFLAFLNPQYWGYITPSGRAPIWVGGSWIGGSAKSIMLFPRSRCIDALRGIVPPYYQLRLDLACERSVGPKPFYLQVAGQADQDAERKLSDMAATVERSPGDVRIDDAVIGYVGFWSPYREGSKGSRVRHLTNIELLSVDTSAALRNLSCLLDWQREKDQIRIVGGSCDGFGSYRHILFDANFRIEPGTREEDISRTIRTTIDEMHGSN